MKFQEMIRSLLLLIRNEISMIQENFFGLPDDSGRTFTCNYQSRQVFRTRWRRHHYLTDSVFPVTFWYCRTRFTRYMDTWKSRKIFYSSSRNWRIKKCWAEQFFDGSLFSFSDDFNFLIQFKWLSHCLVYPAPLSPLLMPSSSYIWRQGGSTQVHIWGWDSIPQIYTHQHLQERVKVKE